MDFDERHGAAPFVSNPIIFEPAIVSSKKGDYFRVNRTVTVKMTPRGRPLMIIGS
jgi:hypothetical protein